VPPAEVDDLIVQLKAGALPLPLEVVAVERIDPAAGAATPGPAASPVGSTGG
jgi:preprotein translocase subunit SecD